MRSFKSIHKREQGQILIISALLIFLFASIGIIPILDFMGTGINTTKNTGLHTQEIYAAEAGVFDAIYKIMNVHQKLPAGTLSPPYSYLIPDGVNGDSVNVTISRVIDMQTFRIHSVATNPYTNHQSVIDSDITIGVAGGLNFKDFTLYAMCSPGSITTKLSDTVNGDIWLGPTGNYTGVPINGDFFYNPITDWPTEELLREYFSLVTDPTKPFSGGTIDVGEPGMAGPLYVYGLGNNNYVMTGTGKLTGAFYIEGNVYLDHNAHIELDTNVIFATGSITTSPHTYIEGTGGILALGDIVFSPSVAPSYLFVMSVGGSVNFQPSGDFHGSVSGNTTINMQPNASITWQNPETGDLKLPGLFNHIKGLSTWAIH